MATIDGLKNLIDKEIDKAIPVAMKQVKYLYKELGNVEYIGENEKNSYKYNWVTFGGSPIMQDYTDHNDPPTTNMKEGYKGEKDYDQKRIAIPVAERTLRKATNKEVAQMVKKNVFILQRSIDRTIEKAFFDDLFNNGTTTTTPDGVPLFSSDHPIKNAEGWNTSTTWSNNYSTANLPTYYGITSMSLGYDQLSAAEHLFQQEKALDGYETDATPGFLLVPTGLKKTAAQLCKSKFDPSSANNSYNEFEGMRYVVSNRLTNATTVSQSAWFLLPQDKMDHGLKVLICKSEVRQYYVEKERTFYFDAYAEFATCAEHPMNIMRCVGS